MNHPSSQILSSTPFRSLTLGRPSDSDMGLPWNGYKTTFPSTRLAKTIKKKIKKVRKTYEGQQKHQHSILTEDATNLFFTSFRPRSIENLDCSMDYSGNRWYGLYIPLEGNKCLVYKRYILPTGWLYATYHLLQEPEKSVELLRNYLCLNSSTCLLEDTWQQSVSVDIAILSREIYRLLFFCNKHVRTATTVQQQSSKI